MPLAHTRPTVHIREENALTQPPAASRGPDPDVLASSADSSAALCRLAMVAWVPSAQPRIVADGGLWTAMMKAASILSEDLP